jgi:hypothetical protein
MALEINDKGFLTDLRSLSRGGSNVATPFPRCAVRVCAIHSRRGAAANESPPDRISSCRSPFYLTQRTEAFRQGLRELGYVEGKNIAIEYRFADGKVDRVLQNAAELVRLKVDVIVTDRFHGTYPPNFNEGTHLISRKGPTQFQVVPFVF